jgi:hypothetical protein
VHIQSRTGVEHRDNVEQSGKKLETSFLQRQVVRHKTNQSQNQGETRRENIMKKLIITLIIATFTSTSILSLQAADPKPAEKKDAPAARALPFRGKITAVDKQAKTVKVGERTFQITADTKIAKVGKPATLDDATVGEEVGGSYREGADKKLNLVSLRIGPRPDAQPKPEEKK